MSARVVAVVLVVLGVGIQVAVLNRVPLGWPAAPDLVLVVLVGIALRLGATTGAVTGFCAGFALDVLPPVESEIGRCAVLLCLTGYLVGSLTPTERDSPLLAIGATAAATVGVGLGHAGIGLLVGDEHVSLGGTVQTLVATLVLTMLLSPLVFFLVSWSMRRFAPDWDTLSHVGDLPMRGGRRR